MSEKTDTEKLRELLAEANRITRYPPLSEYIDICEDVEDYKRLAKETSLLYQMKTDKLQKAIEALEQAKPMIDDWSAEISNLT